MTPEDVHNVGFGRPPLGRRGYGEADVDDFLDVVEADIGERLRVLRAGPMPAVVVRLTAADVHNVAFKRPPRGQRGYDEEEVDEFLGEVEQTIRSLDGELTRLGVRVSRAG